MSNDINIKMSRAKKMMLWVGMISISMTFAGLTSAFIVSCKRADWLSDFIIPNDFLISTILICLLYTSPSPRDRTRSRMPSSA